MHKGIARPAASCRRIAVILIASAMTHASGAADTSTITDPEVRACADRALPARSLRQRVTFEVVDETGTTRTSVGTMLWRRFDDGLAKVFFRIDQSGQYEGVAVLMWERANGDPDVYLYSPELRQERRIASSALAGPLLGTDFSYEDFALLQDLAATGTVRRLPDGEHGGRATYVLESLPANEDSNYARVETAIDRKWCLPSSVRFFARNGSLFKEFQIVPDTVEQIGSRFVPHASVMANLKQGTQTTLRADAIDIDSDIAEDLFSVTTLRRGH
jgi:hypothetical protein